MVEAIRPLGHTSLVEAVTEQLRQFIVNSGLSSGDRLSSETELMKQLGVSRPVLREAVNRLAAVGLLSVRHGSGTFVARREWLASCTKLAGSAMTIEPRELLQFVEFRRVLESYAARQAAQLASPDQIAALHQTLEESLAAAGHGTERAREADFRFHCLLVETGGNPLMRSMLELLHEFIMVSMARTQPPTLGDPESAAIHRAIVKAIRVHAPEAAERAVLAHMDLLTRRLEATPETETPPPPEAKRRAKRSPGKVSSGKRN